MKKNMLLACIATVIFASPVHACLDTQANKCSDDDDKASWSFISLKAGSVSSSGDAIGSIGAGRIYSGEVPLSLSAEASHMSAGKKAFSGIAAGHFRITENAFLKAGGGVTRIKTDGWETAPVARVGFSYLSGISLDLEFSRAYVDHTSDVDTITAGITTYF